MSFTRRGFLGGLVAALVGGRVAASAAKPTHPPVQPPAEDDTHDPIFDDAPNGLGDYVALPKNPSTRIAAGSLVTIDAKSGHAVPWVSGEGSPILGHAVSIADDREHVWVARNP